MLDTALQAQLQTLASQFELSFLQSHLEAVAQPAFFITTTEPDTYQKRGQSRLGGVPDLPPHLSWAKNPVNGLYRSFLAQINLAELPFMTDSPLPKQGILYFYLGEDEPAYHIEHEVVWYSGDMSPLKPAPIPSREEIEIYPEFSDPIYTPYYITFQLGVSLPSYSSEGFNQIPFQNSQQYNAYFSLQNHLKGNRTGKKAYISQLLGFPEDLGFPPAKDAVEYKGEPDRTDYRAWRLLFELDSHQDTQMVWWDAGKLQFMIHEQDLAQADFGNTYAGILTS